MAENNIIEIKDLTKKFGSFTAVDKMTLSIRKGEIFGFLGPNGAGKTTTISMLTTLIQPTSGTAIIAGHNLKDGVHVRSSIGVVPQSFSLFSELTAEENLAYIGKLYGLSKAAIKERSDYLLKKVSLYEHKDRIAGVFSGGMKQRLSLAASIMSSPDILFMDEPTTGLDPQSRIAMRELTQELNKQGMTILYTTHDMEEADKICDRIVIMDQGKIIADGTSEQLKHMIMTGHLLEVRLAPNTPNIPRILEEIRRFPLVTKVSASGSVLNIILGKKDGAFYRISDFFHKKNIPIEEIQYKEPTLEDVFVHLTKKDLRD
jgi:ABC-2 type transport system ATP-binding protein